MKRAVKMEVPEPIKTVRCAVYTRKSTEDGLEQEFNSLDAQREAGENYIKSLAGEGWACLPDRYDDGGFTGGNMDRPALQRLMADIEAGRIDAVVVYKVDRLSRSLLDFARMMQLFDKAKVSFVSVTQQFNTATSMGRLVLNVLLSFAQFEREIISERTRDKIAATRRKGKWSGGRPLLGYDVDANGRRLVVNAAEAERVRAIFELYLQLGSLLPVVEELHQRCWTGKRWRKRDGDEAGGQHFDRAGLHRLLTNVLYTGQIRCKDEVHLGEHPAIVSPELWRKVQDMLARNGRTHGASVRNRSSALLKGLIRCVPCNCAMVPSYSSRGSRRYRYYVCSRAQKCGWRNCPSKSIPAGEIEKFVIEQIRRIGRDAALRNAILDQASQEYATRLADMDAQYAGLTRDLALAHGELQKLATNLTATANDAATLGKLADRQQRIGRIEARLRELDVERRSIRDKAIDGAAAGKALAGFDPIWTAMTLAEQMRVIELLVQRVDYDGSTHKVSVHFCPTGLRTLVEELTHSEKP